MDLNTEMKSKMDSGKGSGNNGSAVKACSDCRTTRTPLWRGGPEGPKSLCNACGIKYNKKKREPSGFDAKRKKDKGKKKPKVTEESSRPSGEMAQPVRAKRTALGRGNNKMFSMLTNRDGSELKEEEHAAILLMVLAYGSVCGYTR